MQKTIADYKKDQIIMPEAYIPQDKTPTKKIKKRRKTQKEVIMQLLTQHDHISVKILLHSGIYQYNARINELNKELAEHNKEIVSVQIDGMCCKRLEVID